jgi:phage repressor protein C with HTH and peptisase S24 domain
MKSRDKPPQRHPPGNPPDGLRLRALRLARGLTMADLADRIGVSQPAISQWESGRERPGRESLQKLSVELGVSIEELTTPSPAAQPAPPQAQQMPADVPVFGTAVGGDSGDFSFNGEVIDYVRRPHGVAQARNVYALWVTGESMAPWNQRGDLIYVTPTRPPAIGDHVVVELAATQQGEAGTAMVKLLVGQTPTHIRLRQYNPAREFSLARNRIKSLHKVLSLRELMGV